MTQAPQLGYNSRKHFNSKVVVLKFRKFIPGDTTNVLRLSATDLALMGLGVVATTGEDLATPVVPLDVVDVITDGVRGKVNPVGIVLR